MRHRFATYANFIKLEHSIFSLPLIFAGMLLYAHGWPSARVMIPIVIAAIGARVMAMGLNRIIDARIDARNPRTQLRELPQGAMALWEAWLVVLTAGVLYLASAWAIAPICFKLSPIPVVLFVVYPYLKRFTMLSHFGLGLAWSMAPLGGWLAVSGSLNGIGEIGWLWAFSVLWVAGFDIIYATMDEAFDRKMGLHSLPAKLGKERSLKWAALLHCLAFVALLLLWQSRLHSVAALTGLLAVGILFIWQHLVAKRRPEFAFFTLNAWLGFLVLSVVISGMR